MENWRNAIIAGRQSNEQTSNNANAGNIVPAEASIAPMEAAPTADNEMVAEAVSSNAGGIEEPPPLSPDPEFPPPSHFALPSSPSPIHVAGNDASQWRTQAKVILLSRPGSTKAMQPCAQSR